MWLTGVGKRTLRLEHQLLFQRTEILLPAPTWLITVCNSCSRVYTLFWLPWVPVTQVVHRYPCKPNTHIHTISISIFKNYCNKALGRQGPHRPRFCSVSSSLPPLHYEVVAASICLSSLTADNSCTLCHLELTSGILHWHAQSPLFLGSEKQMNIAQ